jgi:predicted ester cyclase
MPQSLADTIRAANQSLLVDGRVDRIRDFFTADFIAHGTEAELSGHGAVERFIKALRGAFDGLEVEVEVLLEGSDRVAWQRTLRGIQRGAFQGFPAIGREVIWRDMVVSRFEQGLFAEDWVVTDLAERLLRGKTG